MAHGSLESDEFRQAFLTEVAAAVGRTYAPSGVSFEASRRARLDVLADLVEKHVDVEAITALISHGPPAELPVLPPGDSR